MAGIDRTSRAGVMAVCSVAFMKIVVGRTCRVSPRDAKAVALLMRQQHGDAAGAYVERQLQGMTRRKNPAAAESWRAVLAAIDEISRERRDAA